MRRPALDDAVEPVVGERSDAEAEGDGPGLADGRALLDEVEADRADERPRAEREDDADLPRWPGPREPQQRTEHQRRRGQRTPSERGSKRITSLLSAGPYSSAFALPRLG
jgi:hypothetical protein